MASWSPQTNCGIEVRGLRLATAGAAEMEEVRRRFAEHGVIYFRDVGDDFSPELHMEFAERFGSINVNRFFPRVEGFEGIAQVEKKPGDTQAIGDTFHADHTYDLAPALGSMLVAREVPESGGDTVFVSMTKAYETLPPAVQTQLETMRAVHSSRHAFGTGRNQRKSLFSNPEAATQDTVHPVVIRHPLSGRKSLYVNPVNTTACKLFSLSCVFTPMLWSSQGFTVCIEGQTPEESAPLLEALYHHAVRPEHQQRFSWEPGSAVLWDNRAVWHCAMNDYHGQHRLMHRITINGPKLAAAAPGLPGSLPASGPPVVVFGGGADSPGGPAYVRLLRSTMAVGLTDEGSAAAFPEARL